MEYDVTSYPQGYEKVLNEELGFLPNDIKIKDDFLTSFLIFLLGN